MSGNARPGERSIGALVTRGAVHRCPSARAHNDPGPDEPPRTEIGRRRRWIQGPGLRFGDPTDVLRTGDPVSLKEGVTLPMCGMPVADDELREAADLETGVRTRCTEEKVRCFRNGRGIRMVAMAARATHLGEADAAFPYAESEAVRRALTGCRALLAGGSRP